MLLVVSMLLSLFSKFNYCKQTLGIVGPKRVQRPAFEISSSVDCVSNLDPSWFKKMSLLLSLFSLVFSSSLCVLKYFDVRLSKCMARSVLSAVLALESDESSELSSDSEEFELLLAPKNCVMEVWFGGWTSWFAGWLENQSWRRCIIS